MPSPRKRHSLHLFLVCADAHERLLLRSYFSAQGLAVTEMVSVEAALERRLRTRPDLMLVQADLPGLCGLDLCRSLRAEGDTLPLIILGNQEDDIECVLALEAGADDFVCRPLSHRILLARIKAVVRRAVIDREPVRRRQPSVRIGTCHFDFEARHVETDGTSRVLGAVEYAVLGELVDNPGIALSRERLLSAASTEGRRPLMRRAVDTAVLRLRKMVEPEPSAPCYIRTIHGLGYMYMPEPVH